MILEQRVRKGLDFGKEGRLGETLQGDGHIIQCRCKRRQLGWSESPLDSYGGGLITLHLNIVDDELAEGLPFVHVGDGGHGALGVTLEEGAVFGALVDGEDETAFEIAHLFGQGLGPFGV